ncbi:hypothetical protein CDL15_Pgr000536 [Punica granatum]|nr:hypothetical protein CDL15_Pgr000536 [Punica granatum]
MPCLYISTNVCLEGIDTAPIFSEATKAVVSLTGKPENYVMVLLKGSVDVSLAGTKEPAAYGEIVSMGGINTHVKRQLIASISSILQTYLSVPRTRFFLKVHDLNVGRNVVTPKL